MILRVLIEAIVVHQCEGTGKNRTQRIGIRYRFIGSIDVPEGEEPRFRLDTRQGVAIEYLTGNAV